MNDDLLSLEGVSCGYNDVPVLTDISLSIKRGELVFVLGPNGAGKSTLLKTISGEIRQLKGSITLNGKTLDARPSRRARLGVVHVPEGRGMFPDLTVEENLRLAEHLSRRRIFPQNAEQPKAVDWKFALEQFPEISKREREPAGLLSGGQQQLLALARALICRPELLLIDEPSMGLAPLAIARVEEVMLEMRERGQTVLLVEQNAQLALKVGSRGYVLESGRIQFSGESKAFREESRLMATYFGQSGL